MSRVYMGQIMAECDCRCDLAAPGNLNERRPSFAATPSPPKHDKPWWDGLSSPAVIPRGREHEGMPDDFVRNTGSSWWNQKREFRYDD